MPNFELHWDYFQEIYNFDYFNLVLKDQLEFREIHLIHDQNTGPLRNFHEY